MLNNSKSKPYTFNWIIYDFQDSCKHLLMVNDCDFLYNYYKGLGGPYYDASNCPFSLCEHYSHKLLYYKKGDVIWGTPLVITEINEFNKKISLISIFPNPANDYITVQVPEIHRNITLELWNMSGMKIVEHRLNFLTTKIDISSLSKGFYFVKIIGDSKQQITKLLVN